MILRRLAEALRKQDWFTVIVEFLVVVAGIFVGLQVDNWNESRLERKQERVILERLLAEVESSVAYIEHEIETGANWIESQRQLLDIMFSDDPVPQDTAAAEWGYVTLNFFPAMAPPRSVYDELTSTGGLRLIRSADVRNAISSYYADNDFFLAQLSYFRDFSIAAGNDPSVAARLHVKAVYDPAAELGRRHIFDWNGLRNDSQIGTLFVDKLRNQVVMNSNRQRLLASAKNMCQAIAIEISGECSPVIAGIPE
jgi:hypothetical protein